VSRTWLSCLALFATIADVAAADAPAWRRRVDALDLPLTVVEAQPNVAALVSGGVKGVLAK
jgi:hypothetical protein